MIELDGDFPLAHTAACKMLAQALEHVSKSKGWSQRTVAQKLGYRGSVTVSHMANGRAPIPIDRATDLSRILDMDVSAFVAAVIEQRHPDLDMRILFGGPPSPASRSTKHASLLLAELEAIAGQPLDDLPQSTVNVLREVAGSPLAARRWITAGEIPVIEHLRKAKPDGLRPSEMQSLLEAIESL
ncbi:MAG: helix-turn-helix transcriptional regulator [Novosphingobium sp.]|nr:helix-turn-helix transcriptional regulator [Novosphingobium sp.]